MWKYYSFEYFKKHKVKTDCFFRYPTIYNAIINNNNKQYEIQDNSVQYFLKKEKNKANVIK